MNLHNLFICHAFLQVIFIFHQTHVNQTLVLYLQFMLIKPLYFLYLQFMLIQPLYFLYLQFMLIQPLYFTSSSC